MGMRTIVPHPEDQWRVPPDLNPIRAFGLELTLMEQADLELVCRWRNDPIILPNMNDPRPTTPAMLGTWLRLIRDRSDGLYTALPYIVHHDGEPVGYMELTGIDRKADRYECGLFMFGRQSMANWLPYQVALCWDLVAQRLGLTHADGRSKISNRKGRRFSESVGYKHVRDKGDDRLYRRDRLAPGTRAAMRGLAAMMHMEDEFALLFDRKE